MTLSHSIRHKPPPHPHPHPHSPPHPYSLLHVYPNPIPYPSPFTSHPSPPHPPQVLALDLGDPYDFLSSAVTPPDPNNIRDALLYLDDLCAVSLDAKDREQYKVLESFGAHAAQEQAQGQGQGQVAKRAAGGVHYNSG